jgi:arginase
MSDAVILTPYFLDEPVPGLRPLAKPGWQIIDTPLPNTPEKQQRMIVLHRLIKTAVSQAAQQGQRPVSFAGDCCTTIGVLAGLQAAGQNPTLIWFDAHGDFNTWETTPSGFLGGMPLAMLVGLGEQTMPQGVGLQSLPVEQVILTDGRDLDPGEKVLVAQSGITHLPDVTQLLHHPLPDGPLWVHFDVDVINLDEAPAMNYPAQGGPTVAELEKVFAFLAETGRVTAVSISAWNPELDTDGRTQQNVLKLLNVLLHS